MVKKQVCIFGSGGFAREVYWLAQDCEISVDAFIDLQEGEMLGLPIKTEKFFNSKKHCAIIAVGNPALRKKIVSKLNGASFPSLLHPSATIMGNGKMGVGAIVCANCVLTCDISIGDFCHLNLATTIGHDLDAGDFLTTAPGVHINGNNTIGDEVYFGSNSFTREGISICDDVTIGAGAGVVKHITKPGTYVGLPAKKL